MESTQQERHFYTVLNLTKDAAQSEINDRHRALSLIFHPDKQTDEQLKTTATKEFLEIQKAYQVLSDPFLRQVYDTLGPEGLTLPWPPVVRSRSKEEIQEILEGAGISIKQRKLCDVIIPRGRVTCAFDASPLFDFQSNSRWLSRIQNGIQNTSVYSKSIMYNVERKINGKTSVGFESQGSLHGIRGSVRFLGTIRHQFSPRITTLTTFNFSRPYTTKFEIKYEDPNNSVDVRTAFVPNLSTHPALAISGSRKLFRSKPHRGLVDLHIGKQPSISFFYLSPASLRLTPEDGPSSLRPPTVSGFKYIALEKRIGVVFEAILPKLVAEVSLIVVELSTRFKCSIEYGLTGFLVNLNAHWNNDTASASSSLILHASGIALELHLVYLEQHLSLPVVLSSHFSPRLALGTVVLPSTALALGYHFFVVPRRRAKRLAHLKAAKRTFEEDVDARKERNAVECLLKDAVKKQIRLETEREGLIIQEATYGAAETEDATENLLLDVTIPLQALVRNSQLHIPGGDTKATLQGFSDPAPFASKSLRIRYLFRGCLHYAEIPDYLPVVLPLAEHQVNGSEQ